MNIDDILKEPDHINASQELYARMLKLGGPDLVKQMMTVFETPEEAREWFYTKNYSLDFLRPYDVCKDGKVEKAYNALDAYERAEKGIIA